MVVNLGIATFWLAIGAWLVAMALSPWLRQREIQRTIRVMIEREGRIDAATLETIKGKAPDILAQQDPQAAEDFGRRLFGAGIFFAGLFLGFSSLMFFISPRVGAETLGAINGFLIGAACFVVSVGVSGVIAYQVAKKPRRPKGGE